MEPGPANVIETEAADIWLDGDGHVRVVIHDGASITDEHARQILAAGTQLIGGVKRGFITDITAIKGISRDARNRFASPEAGNNCLATAVLVGSPVSRAVGNFFLGLNRPPFPLRLFTSLDAAKEWLGRYLRPEAQAGEGG